jgi:hypothetical protein
MTPTTRPRPTTLGAAGALALVAAILAAPTQAVPPANDDIAAAEPTTTDPSTVPVDTTEATADPTDGRCVGGQSVWFRFTAPATQRFRLTTAGSSYDTRIAVFRGPRNDRSLVDCDNNSGPGRTSADRMRVREGERYWIAVSSGGQSSVGGTALLTITDHAVEPGVDVEITSVESGAVSGRLFVNGTVECQTPSEVGVFVSVSQRVGDNVARGEGRRSRQCDSDPATDPQAWTVRIDSTTGWAFQPGEASVSMSARLWDGISSLRGINLGTTNQVVGTTDARLAR